MPNIELTAEVNVKSVLMTVDIVNGPGNLRDFVGVYRPDVLDNSPPIFDWKYLANNKQSPRPTVGKTNGTVTLNIVDLTGEYEIRFMKVVGEGNNRVYSVLGRSNKIVFSGEIILPPINQTVVGINPTSGFFTAGSGSANDVIVETIEVTLSPPSPPFSGSFNLSGTDANRFVLNPSTGQIKVGNNDLLEGVYGIKVELVQAGLLGPLSHSFSVTGTGTSNNVIMQDGTPYPPQAGDDYSAGQYVYTILPGSLTALVGTVTLSGYWKNGTPTGSVTGYWTCDGVPISGPITDASELKPFSFSFDTKTVADGTHIFYPKFVDWSKDSAYKLKQYAYPLVVANNGFSTGTQVVAVAHRTAREHNPKPDFITYGGEPNPPITPRPLSTAFIAPDSSTAMRNEAAWMHESVAEPRHTHYGANPAWVTNRNGGVYVYPHRPYNVADINEGIYQIVGSVGDLDGGRLDSTTNPYITAVEYPDGTGWLTIDVSGRLAKIGYDGSVITVHGYRRNRSLLGWDPDDAWSLTSSQRNSKREYIGTTPGVPPGFPNDEYELATGVDVCFDPRDNDVCYVACQLRHCIFRIRLSTGNMTLYAGAWKISGSVNSTTGATNARFREPTSILMSDGTGNKGPIGTMYVADGWNYKIRTISPDGMTVTDLVGKGWFPESNQSAFVDHSVTSMTWSGGTATITLATASLVALGQSVFIQGAIPSGGGKATGCFLVTGFTSSTQFKVAMPGTAMGTFSGTITCRVYKGYIYSPGKNIAVPFADAYVVWPFCIRWTSAGNMVLGEGWSNHVRLIDLAAQTIKQIGVFFGAFENGRPPAEPFFEQRLGAWFWLDCDYAGTCGPIDDIMIFESIMNASHWSWRMSLDGTYAQIGGSDGGFTGQSAPAGYLINGGGHYPWAIAMSRKQARMLSTGFANNAPTQWRKKQPSDPNVTLSGSINIDLNKLKRGWGIHNYGTPQCFPWGVRPAFYALWGEGAPHLGNRPGKNTWDDLMVTYPTDEGLANYIQSGMGGTVTRKELTGNDLRDYIYYIRRNTLKGSQNPIVQPGPDNLDTNIPIVLTLSAIRLNSTSIRINFTTNKSTICLAGAGSAGQQAFSYCKYPIFSDIESDYSTTHSIIINNIPIGMSPVHYTVLVKDIKGNFAHTQNKTVV